jgi:phosphatidyl-myo-inositol alpha-mannosyltransferase
MRVALVTEFYYPHLGGVTEHVYNLARVLNGSGHTAIVVTAHMSEPGTGKEPDDAAFVRRIGTSRVIYSAGSFARVTTGFGLRRRLRALFREERIEIVHVHGGLNPVLGLVAPEAAHDLDIPVVATFHSWFRRSVLCRIFRGELQARLDRYAATIAVSEPVIEAHAKYFSADWEIIPNGVDTSFFRPGGRTGADLSHIRPEVLFLGRLDPRNGLDTLLEAMPTILSQLPNVHLTVAGDGPLRARYERIARSSGTQVSFVGQVNGNRPLYYARAALYVCPTTKASFGITLLEAMACGTPLAVSDITGFRELIAGGDEAVLVPKEDPPAWAAAIVALLSDAQRRRTMAAAGLAKAALFAWPRVAGQVTEVYRRVLSC